MTCLYIGEVNSSIRKYLDRCILHGSLTLDMLAKIESKLLTDFNLKHFGLLYSTGFLDFMLSNEEIKKVVFNILLVERLVQCASSYGTLYHIHNLHPLPQPLTVRDSLPLTFGKERP